MFESDIIDLFIGLSFIYFFLSLICMWVQQIIADFRQLKGKNVVELIQNLLDTPPGMMAKQKLKILYTGNKQKAWEFLTDSGDRLKANIVKTFYENPVIKALYKGKRLPTKISGKEFSLALIDMLKKASVGEIKDAGKAKKNTLTVNNISVMDLVKGAEKIESESTRSAILSFIENAGLQSSNTNENEFKLLQEIFENWYDSAQKRSSGWYKRQIGPSIFVISLLVAGFFNADTIDMFNVLWNQPKVRSGLSAAAANYISRQSDKNPDELLLDETIQEIDKELKEIKSINNLLGWDWEVLSKKLDGAGDAWGKFLVWFFKIIGILITAFGISQGSSFWYDTLRQFVTLRTGGTK